MVCGRGARKVLRRDSAPDVDYQHLQHSHLGAATAGDKIY